MTYPITTTEEDVTTTLTTLIKDESSTIGQRIDIELYPDEDTTPESDSLVTESATTTEEDLDIRPTPTLPSDLEASSVTDIDGSIDDDEPVTSVFIYEFTTSSEVVTRSLLADSGVIISTVPAQEDDTNDTTPEIQPSVPLLTPLVTPTDFEMTTVPVFVVSQTTLDVISTVAPTTDEPRVSASVTLDMTDEATTEATTETTTGAEVTTTIEEEVFTDDMETAETVQQPHRTDHPRQIDISTLEPLSTVDLTDAECRDHVCQNDGVCLSTITGPKCHCPLQFRGAQCEDENHVDVPGFVGHSLLVHKFQEDNTLSDGFQMMISFQTSASDGLVFYAEGKGPSTHGEESVNE